MSGFRLAQLTKWEIFLILPVAGIVLGYTFGGERGRTFRDLIFRVSPARGQIQEDQESHNLTTIEQRNLALEMRALMRTLQQEISDFRARRRATARHEIESPPAPEDSNIILERFIAEPLPLENPSWEHGSEVGEIPAPPYELSDGGRRRYYC
jgi:hypothetical protein